MTIQERLTNDLKSAMKAHDAIRVTTLRLLLAQLKDAAIAKGEALVPEDEISVLTNAVKKRKEALGFYEQSDRTDLIAREKQELEIIQAFLPKQLSDEELDKAVSELIVELGASSMQELGKVMSVAMKQLKGRADGKAVQEIVRRKLS